MLDGGQIVIHVRKEIKEGVQSEEAENILRARLLGIGVIFVR